MRHKFTLCILLLLGIILIIPMVACAGLLELVSEPGPDVQWSVTFGDSGGTTYGTSVQQTTDGGYILCGMIETPDEAGAWLIKTDADGNELWDRTFGGEVETIATSVQQTTDGGYIICGFADLYETGKTEVLLIKTDAAGNQLWEKTFGGKDVAIGNSVQQTTD
ncbi:MAG: hypothetical protein MUO97_02975, partial [Dehalococcoidia bacterium]|nr:hypothetical protein [Dehalococcoidia bacterium]